MPHSLKDLEQRLVRSAIIKLQVHASDLPDHIEAVLYLACADERFAQLELSQLVFGVCVSRRLGGLFLRLGERRPTG